MTQKLKPKLCVNYVVRCIACGSTHTIRANQDDVFLWRHQGKLIQDVMPYLTDDERELFVSGLCGSCFDSLEDGE